MSILAFVNAARNLTNYQADMIVAALRQQAPDFHKAWPGVDLMTPLLFPDQAAFSVGGDIPEGIFPAVFVDDPDIAGVLGYHSVDAGGHYFIRIFVDLLLQRGAWNDAVSQCASHEFLETVLNPTCVLRVVGPPKPSGMYYQKEASDPVEAYSYPLQVSRYGKTEQISVSDFVLPDYFDMGKPAGTKVDFMGVCPGPFQLAIGGYELVGDAINRPTAVWAESFDPLRRQYKELGHRKNGGVK